MWKFPQKLKIRLVILIFFIAGFFGVALLPGDIEGVYDPMKFVSTMGCDCDQFLEFRGGRVVYHVMGSQSMQTLRYEKQASGTVLLKMPPAKYGEEGLLLVKAEPHFLVTKFHDPESSESEWAWKRFITRKMKTHMSAASILGSVNEQHGRRLNTYDANFKVLATRFFPYPEPTSTAPASH